MDILRRKLVLVTIVGLKGLKQEIWEVKLVVTKGYRVQVTLINGYNILLEYYALYKIHLIEGQNMPD